MLILVEQRIVAFALRSLAAARRTLPGTKGEVWQYTAIDAAFASTWAELHDTTAAPTQASPQGSPTA